MKIQLNPFVPIAASLAVLIAPQVRLHAADESVKKPSRAVPALPDNVEKRGVTIYSDGVRMVGDLYLPKGLKADDRKPERFKEVTEMEVEWLNEHHKAKGPGTGPELQTKTLP